MNALPQDVELARSDAAKCHQTMKYPNLGLSRFRSPSVTDTTPQRPKHCKLGLTAPKETSVIAGDSLGEVDVVYLKNVVLKFITAQAAGKTTVRP